MLHCILYYFLITCGFIIIIFFFRAIFIKTIVQCQAYYASALLVTPSIITEAGLTVELFTTWGRYWAPCSFRMSGGIVSSSAVCESQPWAVGLSRSGFEMASLLQPDRVVYLVRGEKKLRAPLSQLYFCRYCSELRSLECVSHEVREMFSLSLIFFNELVC